MEAWQKVLAAAGVAAVLLAGMYGAAMATATSVAAGFSTAQSDSHSRSVAFEAETMRVSAERAAALEKCHQAKRKERLRCRAAVHADEERAIYRSAYRR